MSPTELKYGVSGFTLPYDKTKPNDCNEILSNLENVSQVCEILNPFKSGYLNMQPIGNLYLHSSVGTYITVARRPNGYDNTIINHVAVNSNFNDDF